MQKFNTTDILTGYIKQLLHDFNLPKIKVYKKKYKEYFNTHGYEHPEVLQTITTVTTENSIEYPTNLRYVPYLKEGRIQEYIDGQWQDLGFKSHNKAKHQHYYNYGDKLLNYTKTLRLKDNTYDSYTHEYLGDYLRFKRDYYDLDLMPLYNCFSNKICEKLNLEWTIVNPEIKEFGNILIDSETGEETVELNTTTNDQTTVVKTQTQTYKFSTDDSNYKIYMVPVKLFNEYTIAIDCESPIEFCCGLYGDYQDTRDRFKTLPKITYQKLSHSNFSMPFKYSKLNLETIGSCLDINSEMELLQNESDLKLFIKLPKNNNSTIVILEGDYLNWNDSCFAKKQSSVIIVNFYGEGTPNSVTATAANQLYLDIKNCSLYQSYVDGLNNLAWFYYGPILKYSSIDNLGFLTAEDPRRNPNNLYDIKKNFNLHIDSKEYLSTNGTQLDIKECFNQYKMTAASTANKNLNKYSIYFNTNLKQILINPIETWERWTNYSILNIDKLSDDQDICLTTPLQLLQFNTQEQHPFADRLIEYLLENVITNDYDEIPENIKRAQKIIALNKNTNDYYIKYSGVWDYRMNKLLYEYINTYHNTFETNHDILGYIDKDVEKYYKHTDYKTDSFGKIKEVTTSILNSELDEEGN